MKNKIPIKRILPLIVITLFLSLVVGNLANKTNAQDNIAKNQDGQDNKFIISQKDGDLFDLTNLRPGDTKEGKITIENGYDKGYGIFIMVERVYSLTNNQGRDLLESLIITIYSEEKEIYQAPMKDYLLENIELGRVEAGESREFKIKAQLLDWEDKGISRKNRTNIKWIIKAQADQILGDEDVALVSNQNIDETILIKPKEFAIILPHNRDRQNLIYLLLISISFTLVMGSFIKKEVFN